MSKKPRGQCSISRLNKRHVFLFSGSAYSPAMKRALTLTVAFFATLLLFACEGTWNNPYSGKLDSNDLHVSFDERPKTLDPARSYSSNEYRFIAQIYEPPLQYAYLVRPYHLIPLTSRDKPKISYRDREGNVVLEPGEDIFAVYEITLKSGVLFQPHPSFAMRDSGEYLYHHLDPGAPMRRLSDFEQAATRELVAEDYVYQIKRLADPANSSPISQLLRKHVQGFETLNAEIQSLREKKQAGWVDLRPLTLAGVRATGKYRYQITVNSMYPQFIYWLAMPFFAPMPWEADRFYAQEVLQKRNITLDWYPIGTGAYMLTENNPNLRMVLERNPHYRKDYYPLEGTQEDMSAHLLVDAGKEVPFINRAIYSLEKESIPYWNKFLQGYYDISGVGSESFDQAVTLGTRGQFELTDYMRSHDIGMHSSVAPSIYYFGFNMTDPVVGGDGERARKLRQAISIAVDTEEFIAIFQNGQGIPAQGPLPPGIPGYVPGRKGINDVVYKWEDGAPVRRSLEKARELMAEAGYGLGIDARTKKPLLLKFVTAQSSSEDQPRLRWLQKQFSKLGITINFETVDYNLFQKKIRTGAAQFFMWGWNADYPDPENFFFLLYGENSKVNNGGENAANYANPEFDRLFRIMEGMSDGPGRLAIIGQMMTIVREDCPWIWGFYPTTYSLNHGWLKNVKPNAMARNTLRFWRLDGDQRAVKTERWNTPISWPILAMLLILVLLLLPAVVSYHKKRNRTAL